MTYNAATRTVALHRHDERLLVAELSREVCSDIDCADGLFGLVLTVDEGTDDDDDDDGVKDFEVDAGVEDVDAEIRAGPRLVQFLLAVLQLIYHVHASVS